MRKSLQDQGITNKTQLFWVESFNYLLPQVNTICFNAYLNELSKEYNYRKIELIMDPAGWHRSQDLQLPHNIEIINLPPYSPELNPARPRRSDM